MVLSIGTKNFTLFLNHILKLDKGLRVCDDLMLTCLLIKEIVIKLSKVVIHVFATCIF